MLLLALIVLYGLSCSSGGGRAMPLLETADSLMLSDPDAARQMLLSTTFVRSRCSVILLFGRQCGFSGVESSRGCMPALL